MTAHKDLIEAVKKAATTGDDADEKAAHVLIEAEAKQLVTEWAEEDGNCWCIVLKSLGMCLQLREAIKKVAGPDADFTDMQFGGIAAGDDSAGIAALMRNRKKKPPPKPPVS